MRKSNRLRLRSQAIQAAPEYWRFDGADSMRDGGDARGIAHQATDSVTEAVNAPPLKRQKAR